MPTTPHSSHHRKRGRRYYLSDIPMEQAVEKFHAALESLGALDHSPAEAVPLDRAQGRITAAPVWAKSSSPHYDSAAMDGVAVRARDTVGATETSPVRLTIGDQALWIDTGDPMPSGYDAVIMVEVVHEVDEATIEIMSPTAPYEHVRPLGEDIVATELVLPENHRIRPVDLGACAAAGLTELQVRRRPSVAVIPTGAELVPLGSPLKPGDIIESNSLVLAGMVDEWGGLATRWPPVPDDRDKLREAVSRAAQEHDIVLINAGSSAGSADYTAEVVEEVGKLLVHGIAVRPAHPVVLGVVNNTPVLGIPGYPVSSFLSCDLLVRPLIERKLGVFGPRREEVTATITRKVLSPMGEDEYLRVRVGRVGERLFATPVQRGAGVIMSLVRADGLVVIPRFSEGLNTSQKVTVELHRPLREIEGTIVAIGSHDLTLDLLASHIHRVNPALSLSSSNIGSLGGLMALDRGEAHMAGTHLLDQDSGEYNLSFVRRYVKGRPVVVMNLVQRVQGLMVTKGNPKGIGSLHDLAEAGTRFINRQRGSGTRVLLDYMLGKSNIPGTSISGYNREEYTHLAVAAAIAGGHADTGLGILSAARAMGLDFVPLLTERYDLVVPLEFYDSDLLQPLLALVRSDDFQGEVQALGGYDTALTGQVMAEIG